MAEEPAGLKFEDILSRRIVGPFRPYAPHHFTRRPACRHPLEKAGELIIRGL